MDHDVDLRAQFLRLRELDDSLVLEVATVEWPSPHTPELGWHMAHRFMSAPSPDELERAQQAALENPRSFRECDRCGERRNAGHMHSTTICQGCAEQHLGIVH